MKELSQLIRQCTEDLASIGIVCGTVARWEINTRAKSRWGQCRQVGANAFHISISDKLLRDGAGDQAAKDTIVHELLHTVPGCMQHTGLWKQLADQVNAQLPGYCIQRASRPGEKGVSAPPPRYILQCTSCGQTVSRLRKSKLVQHPEGYRCGVCGGVFTVK